ncbi:MAG: WD40 repeat domain-containing protein [Chloroflexota bacterium]
MTRLLAILTLFVALFVAHPASAQVQPDVFSETLHIGRGAALNAQWHPSGKWILVDTVIGAWLYSDTMEDVARLPDIRLAKFSLDGTVVAGIDSANQLTMWGWDNSTFTQFAAYPSDMTYVTALEWSPDGTQIATLDQSGRILVWDKVAAVLQFEVRLNGATQIAWSKNGSYLAAINSESQVVMVWNHEGNAIFNNNPHDFTRDEANIVWRNDTQLMRQVQSDLSDGHIWDVSTQKDLGIHKIGYTSSYSPDGSKIANSYVGVVSIVDASTGNAFVTAQIPDSFPEHYIVASTSAWSFDNQQVAFGTVSPDVDDTSDVLIIDVRSGKVLHQLTQYYPSVKYIYWSPDNQRLLVVDGANRVSITALADGVTYGRYGTVHTEVGSTAAWNTDGTLIAAADTKGGFNVWDTMEGVSTAFMYMGAAPIKIVWQPHGTLVAAQVADWWRWRSTDYSIYIWDTAHELDDNNALVTIPNQEVVADIAWSPDGKTLAISERSRFIRLWSPATPDWVRTIDLWAIRDTPNIDYTKSINTIGWNQDGTILDFAFDSSGNGGGVWLVDVPAGKMLGGGSPHFDSDWAWTPDNRLVWVNWGHFSHGANIYENLPN